MKLALIRRQFSATSGAELYLQRLLHTLAQKGHELHLFAEGRNPKPTGVLLHPLTARGARSITETFAILKLAAKEKRQ